MNTIAEVINSCFMGNGVGFTAGSMLLDNFTDYSDNCAAIIRLRIHNYQLRKGPVRFQLRENMWILH